ncbi:hypothetical protein LNTAR_04506 [Lentisphaera araneosa HTCC2155]|uniref:Uncharacterized protein n=1 Tax=Lentisphaera araneosa HTCC2155 TaxID=313628 RepID=A6DQK0_9BACT|nr:hypothetical protein LNTAR_04506 [Lentisphaera araneosa HTCC2155]
MTQDRVVASSNLALNPARKGKQNRSKKKRSEIQPSLRVVEGSLASGGFAGRRQFG